MITYLIINDIGEPTCSLQVALIPPNVPSNHIMIDGTQSSSDLMLNYFYDGGEWVFRGQKPESYMWNSELKIYEFDIESAKSKKSQDIRQKCALEITAGYLSDCLGEQYLYPCKDKDQLNMMAAVADSYNPANDATWATPFWCADTNGSWEYRLHTMSQIRQTCADYKMHTARKITKSAQLMAQIEAATQEELNLIIW